MGVNNHWPRTLKVDRWSPATGTKDLVQDELKKWLATIAAHARAAEGAKGVIFSAGATCALIGTSSPPFTDWSRMSVWAIGVPALCEDYVPEALP